LAAAPRLLLKVVIIAWKRGQPRSASDRADGGCPAPERWPQRPCRGPMLVRGL